MLNKKTNILIKPISFSKTEFQHLKQQLSAFDWSMFLESASLEHVDSHWSIYTAQPIASLTENEEGVVFNDFIHNTIEKVEEDPFAAQSRIRNALFHDLDSEFPFTGGVIAAYQYELGELFEKLHKTQQNTGLELGRFYCGFYDWAILYNVKQKKYFLLQQRIKNQTAQVDTLWAIRYQWLTTLTSNQENAPLPFQLTTDWLSNYNQADYQHAFNKIQNYILSGDCYQVNLAQRFQAHYIGDEYQAYCALINENKPPFAAFIRLPEQVILSLSPERFLLSNNKKIQSKPIKGTMPRSLNPEQDLLNKSILLNSEKDQAENLMIVDLLRNDIGRVCQPGSVSVPQLFNIESFPAVHHLVSTVTGVLDARYNSEDLLRACFPGGSITGAPKIRAMEIICELEKNKREIYCGSIAYINGNGDMDSSITIRTLVCNKNKIYCWAGGGIVADSKVDSEYQECFDKVSKILPILSCLNNNDD